jgi:hypothetical protein
MQEQLTPNNIKKNESFDIRELIGKYLSQWKWFVFTVLVFLIFA